jgi:pyruvate kinase
MLKFTKIIATIGPSSDSSEMIEKLINLGVNIFRFNFKHADTNWHKERIRLVKKVCEEKKLRTATLLDLQGPEIRLKMPFDFLELEEGEKILLSENIFSTKEKGFSLSVPEVIENLEEDQQMSADDGLFEFTVKKEGGKIYLLSYSSGKLLNNKAVSIIDLNYDFPTIHEKDREGLMLAKEEERDIIALSFVRNSKDIKELKEEMKKINLNTKIIAKIETQKATKNIDEIIDEADAIMIARGDLGVEMPLEQVPYIQKEIIKKCLQKGVPVITATQMLESMTQNSIPTRAEVSDVANAVYDFTDAVMLSGETANGKYPDEAVEVMAKIIKFSEEKTHITDIRTIFEFELAHTSQMICDSAFNLYKALQLKEHKIKGFLVFTQTGKTSRMLSRYRPHSGIYAFCPNEELVNKLAISYGVKPIFQKSLNKKNEIVKEDIEEAIEVLKKTGSCNLGDIFIVLHGDYWTSESGTSTIRIVKT